jgi:hypothetical protein
MARHRLIRALTRALFPTASILSTYRRRSQQPAPRNPGRCAIARELKQQK